MFVVGFVYFELVVVVVWVGICFGFSVGVFVGVFCVRWIIIDC